MFSGDENRDDHRQPNRTEAHDETGNRPPSRPDLQLGKEFRQASGKAEPRIEENRVRDAERDVIQAGFQAECPAHENRQEDARRGDERQQRGVPEHRRETSCSRLLTRAP